MKKPTSNEFQAKVQKILKHYGDEIPYGLVDIIEELEQDIDCDEDRFRAADEFELLLGKSPHEEDIHTFIVDHPFVLGHSSRYIVNERVAEGLLTKFPVAPDRVPDFVFLSVALTRTQHPNRIDVFELKRPDTQLFSSHNRLSKDLNDAWMEVVETQRLLGLNYSDFLRRAITMVLKNYENGNQHGRYLPNLTDSIMRPRCSFRILIGRRQSLSPEELMRISELGFSTNFSISIATYDSLLDDLRGRPDGETSRWRW